MPVVRDGHEDGDRVLRAQPGRHAELVAHQRAAQLQVGQGLVGARVGAQAGVWLGVCTSASKTAQPSTRTSLQSCPGSKWGRVHTYPNLQMAFSASRPSDDVCDETCPESTFTNVEDLAA